MRAPTRCSSDYAAEVSLDGRFREIAVAHQAHRDAPGLPAARDEPAEGRGAPFFLARVIALGIPLPRKRDDLRRRQRARTVLERPPKREIFPEALDRHDPVDVFV